MSMQNGGGAENDAPNQNPAQGAQAAPATAQLNVLAQYIKDLSFENPNAPSSLQQQAQQQPPAINIQVNVNAKPLGGSDFEVELKIEGRAEMTGGMFLFGFDLLYAGVFRIVNVPQENLFAILMIECPRLLFPFARELVASATRNGGFPPLMIDPVDFVTMYRQKLASAQAQAPQMA